MEHLDGILRLVEKEFNALESQGKFRTREEIDSVYKLVDIAKDIYCIWNYEEEMGDDGSMENRSYRGSYNDGAYARGRRYAKRDSMGRYSREGRSYRSYDDGKDEYISQLHDLMNNAPDEQTRQSIQRMIDQM